MSEIKPRQWTVKWDKIQITENYYEGVQIADGISVKKHESVEVIEAEPILQMMNELAAILLTRDCDKIINHEGSGMFNKHHPGCFKCKALEKYKSFLSQIESEAGE